MAKAKSKKTATPFSATKLVRDAWLAGLGSYVKAYEVAKDSIEDAKDRAETLKGRVAGLKDRAQDLTSRRDELVKELIGKGEEIETLAEKNIADARTNVVKFAEPRIEKIRSLIPAAGKGDRVAELEAEVEKLNKKIATLTKKTPAKKAPAKTTAAKKPAARKTAAKPAATKATAAATKPAAPKAAAVKPAPKAVATETKAA